MLFYLIILSSTFFAIYHLLSSHRFKNMEFYHEGDSKGISILVPCHNEELILEYTIKGLVDVIYDDLEVIFINDGSTDNTLQVLDELLDLFPHASTMGVSLSDQLKNIYCSKKYPFIYVIDKQHSGKANSLNIGASFATKELIVTMDGDCVLDKNALLHMSLTFNEEDVIAAGGVVHILQMFKLYEKPTRLVLMQALDYIKGFYIYKTSLAYNDALSIISGAFGAFNRSVVLEVGGFKQGLGEDIDITLRLHQYAKKHSKKVVYNKNAICFTECPEKISQLSKQRIRWQKGFLDAIWNNSSFLFTNIFKSNVSFYIIIDALLSNSFATIVFITNTILILVKLVYNYPPNMIIYYSTTILFNIIYSIIAIRRAKQSISFLPSKLLYYTIIYDVLFFQFLRIYYFFKGTIAYFFDKENWNKVDRTNNYYKI